MSTVISPTRQRIESLLNYGLNATDNATVTRSKIWLCYGDVILQVESTQFRVNRDVLAAQSSVFRDLFSMPQPPNQVTVEGCHVVELFDAPEDWASMLEVLYDPFRQQARVDFKVLAAMLRLGRKYEITQAYEDAVSRIHDEFPSDFKVFQKLGADMARIKYHRGIYCDLLNLAYDCGIYSSVPLLAFCCLRDGLELIILTGVQRDDRSYATISDDLKIRMALAFGRIAFFQHQSLSWLRDESVIPSCSCQSPRRCMQQRNAMVRIVDQDHEGRFNLGYTIDEWDDRWTGMLCAVCEEAATMTYTQEREKGWELLPTFFGLPEWKDLKDVD